MQKSGEEKRKELQGELDKKEEELKKLQDARCKTFVRLVLFSSLADEREEARDGTCAPASSRVHGQIVGSRSPGHPGPLNLRGFDQTIHCSTQDWTLQNPGLVPLFFDLRGEFEMTLDTSVGGDATSWYSSALASRQSVVT